MTECVRRSRGLCCRSRNLFIDPRKARPRRRMFHPGDGIGPYTLLRTLGRGAFGEVWLAERRSSLLTTQVALKLPLDDTPDLEAIRQEAQVWLKASGHPNIVPVLEAEVYDGQ